MLVPDHLDWVGQSCVSDLKDTFKEQNVKWSHSQAVWDTTLETRAVSNSQKHFKDCSERQVMKTGYCTALHMVLLCLPPTKSAHKPQMQ